MTTDVPADLQSSFPPAARLRRRADFLRASKSGARITTRLFAMQMARGAEADEKPDQAVTRFGFTVTRKVAGAVGRNRIRRRLKEALRVSDAALGAQAGRDYVFVARRAALDAPFTEIISQMTEGFARLDSRGAANSRRKPKDRPSAP